MAEQSAKGEHLSSADVTFVNEMITMHVSDGHVCGGPTVTYDGWYDELMLGADVTDPDVRSPTCIRRRRKASCRWAKNSRDVSSSASIGPTACARTRAPCTRITRSFPASASATRSGRVPPPDPEWLAPIVAHAVMSSVPDGGATE